MEIESFYNLKAAERWSYVKSCKILGYLKDAASSSAVPDL
jgi:hypothetical protein